MKSKHILIAAGATLLAILWAGLFWGGLVWLLPRTGFHGDTMHVTPVRIEVRPGNTDLFGDPGPPAEIAGIGAVLRANGEAGLPEVMNALPGSPAERARLTAGMLIQKVDDTSLAGLPLAECIHLIRGPVGSRIRLEVVDPEQKSVRSVQLIRERVQVGGPR